MTAEYGDLFGRGVTNPESQPIHHLSFATSPVTAFMNGLACWQGSGFFYLHHQQDENFLFLITVRHLFAPAAYAGLESVSPDTATFHLRTSIDEPRSVRPVRVPLYTRDGDRTWLESRQRPDLEIAAIPVPGSICDGIPVFCIDRTWSSPAVATLSAGEPLHVIGFAYSSEAHPGALPLWHAGSLATDPGSRVAGESSLWANVPPFPGMAGAPAVAAPNGSTERQSPFRRLIGVYTGARSLSGRTAEDVGVRDGIDNVLREFPPWGAICPAEAIDELIEDTDLERWRQEVLGRLA